MSTVITAAAAGISTIFTSLESVDVSKLLAVGPALIGIGAGLAALGAGGVIEAIGSFLGGDPIKKIERLAATGPMLMITSAALQTLSSSLDKFNDVDTDKLDAIGPALQSIGIGLMALGGGGILTAVASFLGGDPIEKLERLANTSDGLQKAATSLQNIASSLLNVSSALNNVDISKLEAIKESAGGGSSIGEKVSSIGENIMSGVSDFFSNPLESIGSFFGGGEEEPKSITPQTTTTKAETITPNITPTNTLKEGNITPGNIDLTPMITAIKEVTSAVNRLYGKETSISMDGTKVGTTLTQGSYRVA